MRFHVMRRRIIDQDFCDFFQTNDIMEAKDFAMRLAFEETNIVKVWDEQRQEYVRDFDSPLYH